MVQIQSSTNKAWISDVFLFTSILSIKPLRAFAFLLSFPNNNLLVYN